MKRIGLVYLSPNFDSVPSLCNTVILLRQHGYFVDIYTFARLDFGVPKFGDGVNVTILPPLEFDPIYPASSWYGPVGNSLVSRLRGRLRILRVVSSRIRALLRSFGESFTAIKRHRQNPYQCFIGVDPNGLVKAHALSRFIRVPVVYYSLELFLSDELTGFWQKRLKRIERLLSRKAPFIIIQDQLRAALLAEDNKLPEDKFVLVPNSPFGQAHSRTSDYWHRKFELPKDAKIVLHAGSFGDWTGIDQIAKSTKNWPKNWVLVIHTRNNKESSEEVKELQSLVSPDRVFFSLKGVSREEFDELVDAAHVGIAFYIPSGDVYSQKNIEIIGMSSGKISYSLKAGNPVIVNATSSICKFVQDEGCGLVVEKPETIGESLSEIDQDYDAFSERAKDAFNNHFDSSGGFSSVLDQIDAL